jgi:septal ring factor EnvC (AmiA/AmiB activator)
MMRKPSAIALGLLGATALAITMSSRLVAGQDDASRTALASRATARLRALHEEADRLASQERTVLGELRKLELARQIAQEEFNQADTAVMAATTQLEALNVQVETLERTRDEERPRLAARFSEMYKLGRGGYAKRLLSVADVRSLGRTVRTLASLADRDRARVRAYEARLITLQASRTEVGAQQRTLDARRAEAAKARTTTNAAIAARAALVREIDERRDLNAQLVSELQAAQQKLDATLSAGGTAPVALPIGSFRRALPWPVTGAVRRPQDSARSQRLGVEITATEGTPVRAVHDGVVAYAGNFDGLGNLVIVDHGEQTFSLYGHLIDIAVGRGTAVTAQQTLGRVGLTTVGAPALYFEMRVNGKSVDPLAWLERRAGSPERVAELEEPEAR